MSIIQKQNVKNIMIQVGIGFLMMLFLMPKPKKQVIWMGDPEPLEPDYKPQYFKDSEYFGKNIIPTDYYSNWLQIAKILDGFRSAFGAPILIKKGFNIKESYFNTCSAVEIYPQNNNVDHLKDVINFMLPEIKNISVELKSDNNFLIKLI